METDAAEDVAAHQGAPAAAASPRLRRPRSAEKERVRVRRQTLEVVLEKCRKALELLENDDLGTDLVEEGEVGEEDEREQQEEEKMEEKAAPPLVVAEKSQQLSQSCDSEDELYALLKSKVESPNFLEKLGSVQPIVQDTHDDISSWDMVGASELWEDKHLDEGSESDHDCYVLVKKEDIVDGIACFMATYLSSLQQTKELTPNQLQEALSKTFSIKKKKSKLRKAWDGSKVIYNVASWGATAIGIYQNPAILNAASVAFWSSCRVISKLF